MTDVISRNYRVTPAIKVTLTWQTHVKDKHGWRLLGQHVTEEIAYRFARKARKQLGKETRVVNRDDRDFYWPEHRHPIGNRLI